MTKSGSSERHYSEAVSRAPLSGEKSRPEAGERSRRVLPARVPDRFLISPVRRPIAAASRRGRSMPQRDRANLGRRG